MFPASPPQALSIPISGVNPRSLPGVVVDIKHSAIVIPSFLPARGQRQLRALPPLTAADPRHRVGMLRGLEPSALLFIPPPPPPRKKKNTVAPHSITTNSTSTRWRTENKTSHRRCRMKTSRSGGTSTFDLAVPPLKKKKKKNTTHAHTAATHSRCSVLHVRLLHHISFLRVHIRLRRICINGRTHD